MSAMKPMQNNPTQSTSHKQPGRQTAVVALGMFDGMHIGHQALVGRATELAKSFGCKSGVYTFANHPMTVLGKGIQMLSSPGEREAAFMQLGIEDARMVTFTQALASISPEAFVQMLMALWELKGVVVGFNYTFGDKGRGTWETLAQLGEQYGFFTEVLPPVELLGAPVSSSRIRAYVEAGDVGSAAALLGHPYCLGGEIVANRRIGRRIGFPTANMLPEPERVLPKRGVYATRAILEGTAYAGVTNVGMNPTVNGDHLSIETHLIGFDQDVYGKGLMVEFCKYLRGEQRFDSIEALKEQIGQDVEQTLSMTREIL